MNAHFPVEELCQPSFLWLLPATLGALLLGGIIVVLAPTAVEDALLPLAALVSYACFVRMVERRRPYELGGGLAGLAQFGLGAALALLPIGLLVGVWYALGVNRIVAFEEPQTFLLTVDALLLWAAIAVYEELLFRGLVLRYLELKLGSYAAVALSALAFAAWHLLNPDPGWLGLTGFALSGVTYGCAYVLTRRLWLPLGLHIGHNLIVGLLFASTTTIPLVRWEP